MGARRRENENEDPLEPHRETTQEIRQSLSRANDRVDRLITSLAELQTAQSRLSTLEDALTKAARQKVPAGGIPSGTRPREPDAARRDSR